MNPLSEVEIRVLGALIEKDITTPDYYPLSLNALVNACNQKNNRDPVMALDEEAVRAALDSLQGQRLAGPSGGAGSRVTKYEHRLQEVFNFDRREIAILCVLLLRGPQTPGELRSRAERMYRFEALEDVHATMDRLSQREPPLVAVLPRQPGTKESRYMHLLAGDIPPPELAQMREPVVPLAGNDRIAHLEDEVAALRREIEEMQQQLTSLKKQFK
ncbi:MAG: YceH family protein [Candidatus Sulfotelmatobacter sp.]